MGPVKRAALKKHHNHNPALMKFSHVQAVRILEAKNLDTETVALEIDELLCPKHVRKGGGSLRRYDPTTVESRVKFRSLCDGVCLLNPGCASLFVPDTPQMTAMRSVSGMKRYELDTIRNKLAVLSKDGEFNEPRFRKVMVQHNLTDVVLLDRFFDVYQYNNGLEAVVALDKVVEVLCVCRQGQPLKQLRTLFKLIDIDSSNAISALELFDFVVRLRKRLNLQANHSVIHTCLLYTSPSPRDRTRSRMPSSA
eukprot:TRINITY_DN9308_c0_g2_i6.p2 TRINITY_DN9308_c0_g2~~TRINITY_DN9308_c0_g2_i6.p2  ORF type:complete len:252 (-),score=70.57 TRINITY_DN9308_c0_g2_i6:65-820(-)